MPPRSPAITAGQLNIKCHAIDFTFFFIISHTDFKDRTLPNIYDVAFL